MKEDPILEVRGLTKFYQTVGGMVRAVENVNFTLNKGEVLGIVGESGCGKSTTAKLITRLLEPTHGEIWIAGQPYHTLKGNALKSARTQIQMIFQDPGTSLNPRRRIFATIEEPFLIHRKMSSAERAQNVTWLLDKVGLSSEIGKRLPHELSGGQRQRVGIARALALRPSILVCDEPVSALDVSVRAQIMNLLADLRDELGMSYLFISHDLGTVRFLSDRVAVMECGGIVEIDSMENIFERPQNNYTRQLLEAYPRIMTDSDAN